MSEKLTEFTRELSGLLNRYSFDNEANTPDYILAEFMAGAMLNYCAAMSRTMEWHSWPSLSEKLGLTVLLSADKTEEEKK